MDVIKRVIFAVLACAPALGAANMLRCANRVIQEGTTRAEVAASCGEPTQFDHRTAYHRADFVAPGQPGLTGGSTVEAQIEVWTYNFGPNMLMQRIRFDENGAVAEIESLGYGF